MTEYVIDIESDGPCPGLYNMISFGIVNRKTKTSFLGELAPDVMNNGGIQKARGVSGISWETQLTYEKPEIVMSNAFDWLEKDANSRIVFWSDNPSFDFSYWNYYCHKYMNFNPAGFSARRIGDLYAGITKNFYNQNKWKSLRKTEHSHNPVDDAMGNVEALEQIEKMFKWSKI